MEKEIELFDLVKKMEDRGAKLTIIAEAYGKRYILVQWVKDGNFIYGFKPTDKIAFYDYGIGTTEDFKKRDSNNYKDYYRESTLYQYLGRLLEDGDTKIFVYDRLSDVFFNTKTGNPKLVLESQVKVTITVNGRITNEPLSIETARRLGIIK